jgi:hypothetical protein
MNDLNSLLKTAIDETAHVREEETFLVKDLFKGYEWNRILKGDRLMLGSMFLSYIGTDMTARLSLPTQGPRASSGIRSID